MLRIKDCQFEDRYFAEGHLFENLKDVCEHLIDYHNVDCNMEVEQKLLDEGKIDECWNELSAFEWDIEEVEKVWCGICGREIPEEEYQEDLDNLNNTPYNTCKQCREE